MNRFTQHLPILGVAFLILGGTFLSGVYVGMENVPESRKVNALIHKEYEGTGAVDFNAFWHAWNLLEEQYVPPQTGTTTEITTEDKVYGAIRGLAESLEDPYTTFLPPEDSKIFKEDISGNFEGVGMEIGLRNDVLTIISPLEGSPAKQAGLRAGDKIIAIDDMTTLGMSIDEGVKEIRGEQGTAVKFTLVRDGREQPFTVEVTRDVIDIPSLDSHLRQDGIYVIRLFNFSADSSSVFRQSLREFIVRGNNKLVLDLRSNPGGFLGAAVDMASWFLPTGKIVVEEEFGDDREVRSHRSRGYNVFGPDLQMVVLVDRGTASAAEILAGALQEHNIATIVGEQTFGKGSVQQLEPVAGGSLKITVARWLTPNGTSISHNGLTPDIVVQTPTTTPDGLDPQLEKALEILKK